MTDIRHEIEMLADEVTLHLDVEYTDGHAGEIAIEIDGTFFIDASNRAEFTSKLQALVDEYKI